MTGHGHIVATLDQVLSKLKCQDCEVVDPDFSSVSIQLKFSGKSFFIPRPLIGGGYSQEHLNKIEQTVTALGLELLPLEHYIN